MENFNDEYWYADYVSVIWREIDELYQWFDVEKFDCRCPSPGEDDTNLRLYRSAFNIEEDEDLLFVRDTSMDWKDEGIVITNRAINIIPDNGYSNIVVIEWTDLDHVNYKSERYYFYGNDNKLIYDIGEKYFFKKDPNISAYKKLSSYLTEIAQCVKVRECRHNKEYERALIISKKLVEEHDNHTFLHLEYGFSIFNYEIKHKNNPDEDNLKIALDEFYNVLSVYDYSFIHGYIAVIYKKLDNLWAARNHYLMLMEDEDECQDAMEDLKEIENSLEMDNYIDYKYNDRKLLMPIDDDHIAGCVANGIDVFRMSNIPSCIKFPVGHPVSGQLYIGHPFKPELYVPYETYEETFFVDKVHELCHLLQCLGATEITIESVKGRNVSELYNDSLSVNGDVGIKAFSGSGSYDSNYSSDRSGTSHSRRAMHFSFDPMYKPYVPEGLVWYPESTEWQRLVQNRLHGNMLEYSEHLSTSQTRIINSTEQEKVKASARILWAKANVNVEKSSNNNFKESIETEWKVSVTFRSIREMNEEYEEQSYEENNSEFEELNEMYKLAEQGDAEAQYRLGVCYEIGKGVEQSYEEAVKWYKKAAEQGDTNAQRCLGNCYFDGKGVQQDYGKAVDLFKKAADMGHVFAQVDLAWCYSNGLGVKKDYTKAIDLFENAAKQGVAVAQNNLGYMYEHGFGVEQSYEEAVKWYRKAVEQGYAKSKQHLGECYEKGNGITKDYNKALELYKEALGGTILDEEKEELKEKIDSLTAKMQGKAPVSITQSNDNEQEYIETLKEIIAEDGEITDRERRLLEKLRTKLGISESRAKELEDKLANPSLTAEEQEYLDEYKSIATDGEITDKERKLLDKIRKMSGISEGRAREIEKMA